MYVPPKTHAGAGLLKESFVSLLDMDPLTLVPLGTRIVSSGAWLALGPAV